MTDLLGCRILIVEDEVLIAMNLKDVLLEMGCTIIGPVGAIADALSCIRDEAFDAAILDLNIHGVQSYGVAEALLGIGVPFLFCTGYGSDDVDSAYADNVVLQKPFLPREVVTGLQRIMQQARHRPDRDGSAMFQS